MTDFAGPSLRLLRRLFGGGGQRPSAPVGQSVVLDGMSAVALLEARICESAGIGSGWPAALAARSWTNASRGKTSRLGAVCSSIDADDVRGALAAALGQAMSGQRAVAFANGNELLAAHDLLVAAASRCAPLVVHVAARAPTRHSQPLGGGHDSYHAIADAGWIQFFARDLQEALDLALIARRVTESALIPVLVAMDVETAIGTRDAVLPEDGLLQQYLGAPWDVIESPTPAQRALFGDRRRRTPRWFDVDHPMLLSPGEGPESWALGVLGARTFVAGHARPLIQSALDAFEQAAGRRRELVSADDRSPKTLLVAQGDAIATARSVAKWLMAQRRASVGVLGVHCLRPWASERIAAALENANVVAVLERGDAPLAGDGPLAREIRATLDRCSENARFGPNTHPGHPAIPEKRLPRIVTAGYGLGGFPLRAADVIALVDELAQPVRSRLVLGATTPGDTHYPKRKSAIDKLRRDYPRLGAEALRSDERAPTLAREDAVTVAVLRPATPRWDALATDFAALAHDLFGLHVRVCPELSWRRFDEPRCDLVMLQTESDICVSGDTPVDLVLAANVQTPATVRARVREQTRWIRTDDGDEAVETALGSLLAWTAQRAARAAPSDARLREIRGALMPVGDEARHAALLAAFVRSFHEPLRPGPDAPRSDPPAPDAATPAIARTITREDERVDALPHFWSQVGVLFRDDAVRELTSDPLLTSGAIPALSGAFHRRRQQGATWVDFDPESCDGDGALWTSCPDASVLPIVLSPRALIDAGIDLAAAEGAAVDELRGLAATLARIAHKHVKSSSSRAQNARDLLVAAFEAVREKSSWPAERATSLRAALDAVIERIGELTFARTTPFFGDAEAQSSGTGELLALVVDPDACRCPALLAASGAGRGLVAREATAENIARARRLRSLAERLPDVSGGTIERVRRHPKVGPLAAVMLARSCLCAVGPGDADEPASGVRLVLRNTIGLAESYMQPRVGRLLQRVESLAERLAERIRTLLAEGLPTRDLDQLAAGLEAFPGDHVELARLAEQVEQAVGGGRVDGPRLRRITECARGLADLRWRLSRGANNLGRSRWSTAIVGDSSARLLCVFPNNPFAAPAALGIGGHPGRFAAGLLEGQTRQHLAAVRLLRWAEAELDRPNQAHSIAEMLPQLAFDDLTKEERDLNPPLLLIGDGRSFAGGGLGELTWVLRSGLPIKVVVLSDAGGTSDAGIGVDALAAFPNVQRCDLALAALLTRSGFVAQVSPGNAEHFAHATLEALSFAGPAMIHVHAPSPVRHGFAPMELIEQARRAVESRAFPVFTFDPAADGVFGARLDLSGNPSVESLLHRSGERMLTPVDWAVHEARFGDGLAPLASDAPAPTPFADYVALPPEQRRDRTPFVELGAGEPKQRIAVAARLAQDGVARIEFWRVLQELAGVVTPFTQTVRRRAEHDVAEAHAAEIARLRCDYEARLAELERDFSSRASRRLTDRLMQLAGYSPTPAERKDNGQ